jgi:hypothetical protein
MSYHRKLLLEILNINSLIDPNLIEDLDRLEQLDRLTHWYDGFNPLPNLIELAQHQLKQRVESSALAKFSSNEFEAFKIHWRFLSEDEQRRFLCELAGLPDPQRDRDLED